MTDQAAKLALLSDNDSLNATRQTTARCENLCQHLKGLLLCSVVFGAAGTLMGLSLALKTGAAIGACVGVGTGALFKIALTTYDACQFKR